MGRPSKKPKKASAGRSIEQQKAEARFYVCPSGHQLPNETDAGNCTPAWCAGSAAKVKKDRQNALAKVGKSAVAVADEADEDNKLAVRIDRAKGRRAARLAAVDFPQQPLEGASAEEFADRELVNMLPEAIAELKFKLRFGDDDQREKAAEKVLNATGRGKRDMGGGGAAPIIMLVGQQPGQPVTIPWFQRTTPPKLKDGDK